jgi:hypothetical protein
MALPYGLSEFNDVGKVHCSYNTMTFPTTSTPTPRIVSKEAMQDLQNEDYYLPVFAMVEKAKDVHSELFGQEVLDANEHEVKLLEFLYIDDALISNRIKVGENGIYIQYYKTNDINQFFGFWKRLFMDQFKVCDYINSKNKWLWLEACAVAKAKKLKPVPPPIRYMMG